MANQKKRSKPKFEVGGEIRVPIEVCDGRRARIVGREFAPENKHMNAKHAGWVYYLKFFKADGSEEPIPLGKDLNKTLGFVATERQIVQWQRGL